MRRPSSGYRPNTGDALRRGRRHAGERPRQGKVLALFAVSLPVMLAIAGLVLDSGEMINEARIAQHAADAAAAAAATSLKEGDTISDAIAVAEESVRDENGLGGAGVDVSIPPVSGPFAGDPTAVEVVVRQSATRHFLNLVGGTSVPVVRTRSVARSKPVTAGVAIAVLDPEPPPIAVAGVGGVVPSLPPLTAGLEVLGTSRVRIDGAVLVNTTWGGLDEEGNLAGTTAPPPTGIACGDVLFNNKLRARDIRVVGGVDDPVYYGHYIGGQPSRLRANRLPTADPLRDLPVPTIASDPNNVDPTDRGSVSIDDPSIFSPQRTLQPGVYDWLEIRWGRVRLLPGVYVIRSVNPSTGIALNLSGGWITADGVLFYVTDSAGYTPASGMPDAADGETVPPELGGAPVVPSVVVNSLLFLSRFRGLNDPSSPYDGMLLFQRRTDRRPVVLVSNWYFSNPAFDGTVYAKWGHVCLLGQANRNVRVAAGTLRLLAYGASVMAPNELFPAAEDVALGE